ncbi:oxidoreductase [Aquimarina latercula]|uniref:oxidoreductase n=1 Tax=Aquimarina latercula TaxID=987 RepID=UPI000402998D|nr:oxidoreductase [Aquimarina latercula]
MNSLIKNVGVAILVVILSIFQVNAQQKWDKNSKKIILITGTASGMGKATAEKLIAEGHTVYGGDVQYEKNKFLDGIGGHSLDMDVTNDEEVKAGVAKIIAEQGRIDILINNAGYGLFAPIEEVSIEDAMQQMNVNMFGYARTVKAVLPHMRKQKMGRIINLTSMGGKIYTPLGGWYHASKHAIEGWSDCLRLEVKEFNIDVVVVEPGIIKTNFYNAAMEVSGKYYKDSNYQHMIPDMSSEDSQNLMANATEPGVIADLMNKIVRKRKPKTRYVKGRMAKTAIWYRDVFGDKAYDKLITRSLR